MAARKKAESANNGAAKTTKPKVVAVAAPPHDEIAKLAYQLFCERGGSAFDNWIEAERRLRA